MTNPVTLGEVAEACGGELVGDSDYEVVRVSSVRLATPDALTFLVDGRDFSEGLSSNPGVLIIRISDRDIYDGNRIVVDDPYLAYAMASGLFAKTTFPEETTTGSSTVASSAVIGEDCQIGVGAVIGDRCRLGKRVRVGPGAVIESDCEVGDDTVIESLAAVCTRTRIGDRCTVSPGAVIGSSGFGYAPSSDGWQKIHQLGAVVIGDDVDVGSNATIDRGAIDDTVIGDRVKIDNHVQIAHNVQVGDDTIMAAFVGIAGSARIGKRCQFGGRSSIMGHIRICDDVVVHTNTFVARSIDEPGTFSSMLPAQPAGEWRRTLVLLNRLDRLSASVRKLTGADKSRDRTDDPEQAKTAKKSK